MIITKAGDSIRCQITKTDGKNIYFRYLRNGSVEKSLLPLNEVEKYQHLNPGSKMPVNGLPAEKKYPHFRIGAGGGYSYRLTQIPSDAGDFKEYLQKLKSGFNVEAEAGYFPRKSYGIGLRWHFFRTHNYMDNVMFLVPNGHSYDTLAGNMADDIRINYIEPVFYYRFFNRKESMAWLIGIGLGYAAYMNKGLIRDEDMTLSGSTAGISAILGTDFFVRKDLAIGLVLSVDLGTLTSLTTKYQGKTTKRKLAVQERVDISMVSLTVGLRFWK